MFTFGSSLSHSCISDDGSLMLVTTATPSLQIYGNDGANFTLIQNISITGTNNLVGVTGNDNLIALFGSTGVNIY